MTKTIGKSVYDIFKLLRASERNVKFNQMYKSQEGSIPKVLIKGRMKPWLRFWKGKKSSGGLLGYSKGNFSFSSANNS